MEIQKELDRERAMRMKMIVANAHVRGRVRGWAESARERIDKLSPLYAPGDNSELETLKMIVRNCESIEEILTRSME